MYNTKKYYKENRNNELLLKIDNKLTPKLALMIFNIIKNIPMKIFQDSIIDTDKPLYFIIEDINYKENISNHCYIPNFDSISFLLEEIKKGDWDNYIKASIKELG